MSGHSNLHNNYKSIASYFPMKKYIKQLYYFESKEIDLLVIHWWSIICWRIYIVLNMISYNKNWEQKRTHVCDTAETSIDVLRLHHQKSLLSSDQVRIRLRCRPGNRSNHRQALPQQPCGSSEDSPESAVAEGESPPGFGWCLARSSELKRRRGWNERVRRREIEKECRKERKRQKERKRDPWGGPTVRDPF